MNTDKLVTISHSFYIKNSYVFKLISKARKVEELENYIL